ncbi:MAG: hypothetical protein ABIF09_09375, partial [Gemmatimonadota bacterium]
MQIRAFVWAFQVPQPAFGLKAIAAIDGPSLCIEFPPKWELTVTGPDEEGVEQTNVTVWTPNDPIYITAVDRNDTFVFLGATESFSPADE